MIIENLKQPSFNQNPPISFRDYNNFNEEAFKTELCELDWSFVTENNDINLGFETFLRFINKTLDKHAPIKTVKKRENKTISKPWITRGIKTYYQRYFEQNKKVSKTIWQGIHEIIPSIQKKQKRR